MELAKLWVEENIAVVIYSIIFDLPINVIGSIECNVGSRTKPRSSWFVQQFRRA